ncbi:MAG: response regulator [Chloroflexi bacterium]|nr:response regulator [Chloroflexota bacterium]
MAGYETFLDELQSALNHLNDPAFQPAPSLCQRLGISAGLPDWAEPLRQAIHCLQPPPTAPAQSRSHRLYQLLLQRYIHNETQDRTAEQLHITPRHLRREQNDAVQALARLLWEQPSPSTVAPSPAETPQSEWSAQLRQELTALQKGAPSGTADVGETIQRVVELLAPVQQKAGVVLRVGLLPPGLAVAVQSTGLRQLLVRILTEWSRHLSVGEIDISAEREGEQVRIHLTGSPAAMEQMPDDPLLQELLSQFGGSVQVEQKETTTHLTLSLAAAPPIRVLVVDDNEDLLHFYRRYVANTRYQILSLTDGDLLFETLEEVRPDAVVLDVMLPTADGWELLTHLRQHPLGRTLPILVCSVIQEEELARALGASGYIRKPVGRSRLLRALDAALGVTP